MAVPIALIGTAVQMIGQWSSNMAMAQQELQNQKWYREQALYAQQSMMRAQALAEFDYTNKIGSQVGAYAASGVDVSGSAALTVGGTVKQALEEMWAIRRKGEIDMQLAFMRGDASGDRASTFSSAGYNIMQAGGSLIKNYTSSEGFGGGFASGLNPGSTPPSGGGAPLRYFPSSGGSSSSGPSLTYSSQYFGDYN